MENGVTVAENSGGPRYSQELFNYDLLLTLKPDLENPDSYLHLPYSFVLGADGNYYVSDRGNYRIAIFNSQGEYIDSFGTRGKGPGDFEDPRIQYIDNGILSVFDYRLKRTSLWHTDGSLENVYTPSQWSPLMTDYFVISDNQFLSVILIRDLKDGIVKHSRIATSYSSTGESLWSMATIELPAFYRYSYSGGSGRRGLDYRGMPVIKYVPGNGTVISTGIEPELRWFNESGELQKLVNLGLDAEPISRGERSAMIRRELDSREARIRPSAEVIREASRIIEYKAFWEEVVIDDHGYTWLRVPEPIEEANANGGFKYRVVSPDGEYLGDSMWPWIRGTVRSGRLFTIQQDIETGELIPSVYSIRSNIAELIYP